MLEIFGDRNTKIQELSGMILTKDIAADSVTITEVELAEYTSLKAELWRAEKNVESLWNNHISSLPVDGTTYSEPNDIRVHVRDFYKSLFSYEGRIDFDISDLTFDKISDVQSGSLIKSFKESEMLDAICSCGVNKAPGLDGFNFYFYQRAWPMMKDVVIDFFCKFHSISTLPRGINFSFLVLVPKVVGSSNINDYRPISLINGFYKMLSKALSKRLSPILYKVILKFYMDM
ncbi:uncharacterized protein LOC126681777 [Mercurialis annua]|uniref:uncharacterized protein LOC126681777 n=1 Tax=Mercurialis annua TaxID=3986 RepID=UPI0021605CB2|nr:uncharacterized protein LOC126681777 [Mercurialis annua]